MNTEQNNAVDNTETETWEGLDTVESLLEELSYGGRENHLDDTLGMDSAREILRTTICTLLQSTRADERERIRRWAIDYNEAMVEHYGTDKHGIALEDLLEQLDA